MYFSSNLKFKCYIWDLNNRILIKVNQEKSANKLIFLGCYLQKLNLMQGNKNLKNA